MCINYVFDYVRKLAGIILVALSVTATQVMAAAIDDLQPGHWYRVPNSQLQSVAPNPEPPGNTGFRSVMDAWNGGAYDSNRDSLIVWGGGHLDYSGNELYAFNVNSERWTRVTNPSPVQEDVAYYSDGRPTSRHTYNALVFAPNVDLFLSMGTGAGYGPTGSNNNDYIDAFNFGGNNWLTKQAVLPSSGNRSGNISAYDSATGHVWSHGTLSGGRLVEYDPVSRTTKAHSSYFMEIDGSAAIDPKRHIMVSVGGYQGRQFLVWDLDNPSNPPSSPSTSGATDLESSRAPGFTYDPVSDKFVGWNGGSYVYVLDPDTWKWTKVYPASSNNISPTAPNSHGTYGRFRYIPSKNAFILVNNVAGDVYYYKLTSGGGTSSGNTTPQPTVSITASPSQVSSGGNVTLGWNSSSATSCAASGAWSGTKALSGSQVLSSLTSSGTYTLSCTGSGGSASASVVVTVTSASTSGGTSGALQVGPGMAYQTVAAAAAAAGDGDVIEIAAGTYPDDIVVFRQNNLTIRGVDPDNRAHIQGTRQIPYTSGVDTKNGMALWVVKGSGITVENIEFSGASVPDGNGAGIRIEGADLTIRNCYFHDNENGVLGSGWGTLTIEKSEFAYNGLGDGYTHNIYIDGGDTFVLKDSYSHHAKIGHNVKTRAKNNYIISNRLMDEASGTSSYAIDVPNGGLTYIIGNLVQQGPNTDNSIIVAYAAEGGSNPVQQLNFVNNTVVNDRGSGSFLNISGSPGKVIANNLFVGTGSLGFSGGTSNIATADGKFVNKASYDYRPTASTPGINQGSAPGTNNGYSLVPATQYVHPISSETRPISGTIDVGAYEYNGGGATPTYACSDGVDNDGDGLKDYPGDPGCSSTTDNDEYNTPVSTTYSTGDSIQTTAQVNVRDSANGTTLGTQPSGVSGTVIGGPVSAGGYTWWKIDFGSGVDGWVAENYLADLVITPEPTAGDDIVTVTVSNRSSTSQSGVPVTFGQVFRAGDIPAGMSVQARLTDGTQVPLQVDAKATHGDGSLRHAILTARIPSVSGNGSVQLHLSAGSAAGGAPLSLSSLLGTSYDAKINLNVSGTSYSLSARDLLSSGAPEQWLSGPEVSEWIVGGPVRTSSGNPHPHLAAYFHVRRYADGRVRTDVSVENGWLQVSGPTTFSVSASVQVAGSNVYGPTSLSMPHHTRWHQVYWWKSSGSANPNLSVSHDTNYLRATGAVPNYDSGIKPGSSALNSLTQTIVPMDNAGLTDYMPDTGAQNGIGLLPLWDALYVTSGDSRAFASVLANASGGGAYGAHYRDENTGKPIAYSSYPRLTEQDGSLPGTSGGNPVVHDQAHQPSIGYLAYLISGDYYYLEEMQFWATWNYLWSNPDIRQGSKGIYHVQVRGQAWALRTLGQAAYVTPDADPLKTEFVTSLRHNLSAKMAEYSSNPGANKLGAIASYDGYTNFKPWMDDFYTMTMGYLVDLGFYEATEMRNWKAINPLGRMGTTQYCYLKAASYVLTVGTSNSVWFPDFRTLYEANHGSNNSCPEGGLMDGYSDIPDGYVANLRPALATAVDAGLQGALEAWNRMINSAAHPNFNDNPIWGISPRSLDGSSTGGGSSSGGTTTPAPVVSLAAQPASITAGGSTTIAWSATNATGCTASGGWSGSKPVSGNQLVSGIASSTVYALTCNGAGGSGSNSVTVTVSGDSAGGGSTGGDSTGGGSTGGAVTADLPALSFSSYADGANPVDWYDSAANNSMTRDDSLFDIFSVNGNKAFGTSSLSDTNIHSHYTGAGSADWSDYRYTGRMRVSTSSDAIGVTFYSDYPNSDYYYRLRREANGTFHIAPHGSSIECAGDADTGVSPSANTWYQFLVEVENNGTQTDIRAKVWPQGSTVPGNWQVSCSDTGTRLVQGTVGLWAVVSGHDTGNKYWDDLAVEPLGLGGGSTSPAAPVVSLSASPTAVAYGGTSVLSWSSSNADSCSASGSWTGSKGTSGTQSVGPVYAASAYSLSCTGAGGTATRMITVNVSGSSSDTDADGLPDSWEIENFGGLERNGTGDLDGDGLSDLQEYASGTSPINQDTDGDGISDGQEFADGSDPTRSDLLEAPIVTVDSVMSVRDSSADVTVQGETTSGVVVDMAAGELRIQLSDNSEFSGSLVMDRRIDVVDNVRLPSSVLKTSRQYWIRASVSDSNGRKSGWSQAAGFSTDVYDPLDQDGDGIDDQDQVYGYVDTDGNSVQDTDEGMCAMLDPVSQMPVGLRTEAGSLRCASAGTLEELPGNRSGGKKVPKGLKNRLSHGLYNFIVEDLPVNPDNPATVTVKFYFSDNIGVNNWYKYDEMTTEAADYSSNVVIDGNTATVVLVDGGAGDADGVVNGRIIDPSGPTDFDQATASNADGGGGGATRITSLLVLLFLVLLGHVYRARAR